MIAWEVFKSNMTSYLSSAMAPDTKSFVNFFLTQFDLALRTGGNVNGNLILKTNLEIALTTTTAAMELQKAVNDSLYEINSNIDMIIDDVISNELNNAIKDGTGTNKDTSSDSIIIKQAKSLISSIVSPIINNIVSSLSGGNLKADDVKKLVETGVDKNKIKQQIKDKFDTTDKTFDIIADGISLTLMMTNLLPVPPMPPTTLPNYSVPYPCLIIIPGDIKGLAKDLKTAMNDNAATKTPDLCSQMIGLALQKYVMTVGGLYFGLLYIGVGFVPAPPIPWLGLI